MTLTTKSLVLISLCAGLLAAILVYHYLTNEKSRVAQTTQRVWVVVTTRPIAARTLIEPTAVKAMALPAGTLPTNCATSLDEVVGQVAVASLAQGEPVPRKAIMPRDASLGLSFAVPSGMRAVAVSLDPISGVAGFLKPGDRVDVIATFTTEQLKVTRTVLQDVALLAMGSEVRTTGGSSPVADKDAAPKNQPNAILVVSPDQAEKLILAEVDGRLRLTLRSVEDQGFVSLTGVRSDALTGIPISNPIPTNIAATPKHGSSTPAVLTTTTSRIHPVATNSAASPSPSPASSGQGSSSTAQKPDTERIETIRGTEKTIIEVPIERTSEKGPKAP